MATGTPRRPGAETKSEVWVYSDDGYVASTDRLTTEEPLEIRLSSGSERQTLAITMRTPGADFDLVTGFLFGEGIIHDHKDVDRIAYCVDRREDEQLYNVVTVELNGGLPDLPSLERHFYTTSSCGVCGKANIESLRLRCEPVADGVTVTPDVLYALPGTLGDSQGIFRRTGGLHAAALFDPDGRVVAAREDVGRHNALDKLIGHSLKEGLVPLSGQVAMVSGRASYEIMQKCLTARVPVVCAVSAPSSLAVSVAREFGITLVGFLRGRRFNVYAHPERISLDDSVAGVVARATNRH